MVKKTNSYTRENKSNHIFPKKCSGCIEKENENGILGKLNDIIF